MKILYAASDRKGASIQLSRILKNIDSSDTIKIAGYSNLNIPSDWNLESLRDMFNPKAYSFDNENLQIYYQQVKKYNPDLIISDLEIFTSYIAPELGSQIWQVSPMLLHYATPYKEKVSIGLLKRYPFLDQDSTIANILKNIIFNADRKMVYSHFGDVGAFSPIEGFEWVRPYHIVGRRSAPCQHNIVAATLRNNKKIISYLKRNEDTVLFSNFNLECYPGVILKDIADQDEYACNLKNSDLFVCQGHNDFVADAYYNGKHPTIFPDFEENECIVNSMYSEKFKTGTLQYSNEFNIQETEQEVLIDNHIKYLHEKIKEL